MFDSFQLTHFKNRKRPMYIGFYNSIGNNTSGAFLKLFTWQKPSFIKSKNSQQQQQQHFPSPHNIQEIKIYNNSTDDDRGAGCPKKPKSCLKMPGSQLKEKMFKCLTFVSCSTFNNATRFFKHSMKVTIIKEVIPENVLKIG